MSASGGGGDNGIAQGIMRDTGPQPPRPAFSPALAVQKHGNQPVAVTLRAGDGDGPWWIAIQRGFGPLYLEQIGFGVTMPNQRVESISLLMDGSVSMFGLTCAVDDLQITYFTADGDFFNPANWSVDLAGLAVSADMAGLVISGGLLKQESAAGIEYLGMLLGPLRRVRHHHLRRLRRGQRQRHQVHRLLRRRRRQRPDRRAALRSSSPASAAASASTGRSSCPPTCPTSASYPLIQALDIAASPQDPMAQLRELGQYFPMQQGTFWFAAGISFNSFALVDGIAVVAIEIGDGLDINLLGLARMALPRPQVAIVSIELALLVRFSSSEGVLWVQGQLTDNSWLLYPDVKPHRRLRLRHLVQGRAQGRVRAHDRRLPPGLPP